MEKKQSSKTEDLIIGGAGWFIMGNSLVGLFYVIGMVLPLNFLHVAGIGYGCMWLATILSIPILWVKRRAWYSMGIIIAVVANTGFGLFLALRIFDDSLKIFLIVMAPFPLSYLVAVIAMMSPPY